MISRTSKAQIMALCPGHDTQHGALTEALKALWAVRVLDAAEKRGCIVDWHIRDVLKISLPGSPMASTFHFDDKDQCRIAAANMLVEELPVLSPKGWP